MKSIDFVEKIANGEQKNAKNVSSLYFDGERLYSYGVHYPLLFKVKGAWFVNDVGYSPTTNRHIHYARLFAQYRVALNLRPTYSYNELYDVDNVEKSLTSEIYQISARLATIKPTATRQIPMLQARLAELTKSLNYLKS